MANPKTQNDYILSVTAPSQNLIDLFRTILEYEAAASGCTRGQALHRIVMRRAKQGDYPAEVMDRLAEIDEERRKSAARATAFSVTA